MVNPKTRRETMTDTGRVILKGINKYENIKYTVRPEIKDPGNNITILYDIEVTQSLLCHNNYPINNITLGNFVLIYS